MPKFTVTVKVIATCSYTVEVEADTESAAESLAVEMYADQSPEDFQVAKGYIEWELDSEQKTAVCPDCGTEHVIPYYDLKVCHCAQFVAETGDHLLHRLQHLNIDDKCVAAPWWWNDQDYCAACGMKIELKDAALARGHRRGPHAPSA